MSASTSRVQAAHGLLKRFWARETHAGRITPPGFAAPAVPQPSASSSRALPNPFLPLLNPTTGKWRAPRYSRRRQAELVKAARLLQVEPVLLPLGPKGQRQLGGVPSANPVDPTGLGERVTTETTKIEWVGTPPPLNEKGLYGSRRFMFKGHKWERQLPEREQSLHDYKVKFDKQRAAVEARERKFERRAERARREGGILQ